MKKFTSTIAFSLMLIVITSHSAFAQLSIRPEIGYQFSLAGGLLGENYNINADHYYSQTGVYGSLGQGLAFGVALDYKFCPCFTLELAGRYWDGAAIKNTWFAADTGGGAETNIKQSNLHLFAISLGDFYDFNCGGKFDPYLGLGIDFNVSGVVKESESYTNVNLVTDATSVGIINSTLSGNFTVGAYGELGAKYHLSSHFSVFGEIRIDVISFTPNKLIINSVIDNGINITNTYSTVNTEIDYVKSVPITANTNSTQPYQEIASPLPASTWGINMGVVYNFGSWSKSGDKK